MSTHAIHPSYIGSGFSLARWFQQAEDASGLCDDDKREAILNELVHDLDAFGVFEDGAVIIETTNGTCIVEVDDVSRAVFFDYCPNDRWARTRFWMNKHSVKHIGDALRQADKDGGFRCDPTALLVGAASRRGVSK